MSRRRLRSGYAWRGATGSLAVSEWIVPTTMADGTAIGTISDQTIHYDTVSRMGTGVEYAYSFSVGSPSATTKTVTGLNTGTTYYYAMSVSIAGVRGEYSTEKSGVAV